MPDHPAAEDEDEYRFQANADDFEQRSGGRHAGESQQPDGPEKAEAAERASGEIKD